MNLQKNPYQKQLNSIWNKSIATFKAPEKLKVSEWSDKYRVLTSESSAEAGQWKTNRAEYQRGMMDAVNAKFGDGTAKALDSTSIVVRAPEGIEQKITFLSMLENLTVEPGEAAAKVIVNSRTGTVVIGSNVKVMPAAVTHGSLVVTVKENVSVSQPGAFSPRGQTAVITDTDISAKEEQNKMFKIDGFVTLDQIVRAVNEVGAAPSDLVAVLEALDRLGALKAELIVI